MTLEKLGNELGICASTVLTYLKKNGYKTNPMDDEAIDAARIHYKDRAYEVAKPKPLINKLCIGCPKGRLSDEQCWVDGTYKTCRTYNHNREKRKGNMGIVHKERGVMNVSSKK